MLVTNIIDMDRWNRTHESLSRAALELFTQRGYDATGTAQIAERAGVSEMTLFRHFPSKEALLLADPFDPLIAAAVRRRPADEPPMRALAEGVREAWASIDAVSSAGLRDRLRIVAAASGLDGAIERNSTATIGALADALSDRGIPMGQARVAASAVITGLSVALVDWARADDRDHGDLDGVVARALDVLGGA